MAQTDQAARDSAGSGDTSRCAEQPGKATLGVPTQSITGVIMAGGMGRRMGGEDKGLLQIRGKPMIQYVLETLRPQVGRILINANRNLDRYRRLGCPVVVDISGDFLGPLAGMASALQASETEYLLTVPCDSPLLPATLAEILFQALQGQQAQISVASDGQRMQPVFALLRRSLLPSLLDYLAQGGRKIDTWYAQHTTALADCSGFPDAFVNVNTPQEQTLVEQKLNASTMKPQESCADARESSAVSVEQARERVAQAIQPLAGWQKLSVRAALGRVLARDIASPCNVPAHDNSAMDGYALAASDLPESDERTLRVVATALAGRPWREPIGPGQCVRIMTGAVLPPGADTVVIQEQVDREGERVRIGPGHRPGQNVRRAGEDLALGQLALAAGKRLGPAELGLLASLGMAEIPVRRQPRVAFFSTGDELRSIGEPLGDGEVFDSNRYTLHGMLSRLGVEPVDLGVIRDDPEALREAFRDAAANADAVITSGGVSVGEADYVKAILAELGQVELWKIAMKPGRPLAFGLLGDRPFFGLPGNPVAVMVTFYQFVQPALRRLAGETEYLPRRFPVPCQTRMKKRPGRTEFQRARLELDPEGHLSVRPTGKQGSGVLSSMSHADCLIVLPSESGDVEPGDLVPVEPFRGLV